MNDKLVNYYEKNFPRTRVVVIDLHSRVSNCIRFFFTKDGFGRGGHNKNCCKRRKNTYKDY